MTAWIGATTIVALLLVVESAEAAPPLLARVDILLDEGRFREARALVDAESLETVADHVAAARVHAKLLEASVALHHAQAAREALDPNDPDTVLAGRVFLELARASRLRRQYEAAAHALEEADRRLATAGDPTTSDVEFEHALLQRALGSTERADEHARTAHALRSRSYAEGDPNRAMTLYLLGQLALDRGEVDAGLALLVRARDDVADSWGPDHLAVAQIGNTLALGLRDSGEILDAERVATRSAQVWEEWFGSEHPYVAGQLNNLASIRLLLGDLDGARQAHQQSRRIRAAAHGAEHPAVAQSLVGLAIVENEARSFAEARALLEQALAIRVAAHGAEHPTVALTRLNLGAALLKEGRLDEAVVELESARDFYATHTGAADLKSEHAEVEFNLAQVALLRGDLGAARSLLESSATRMGEARGDRGSDVLDARLAVAACAALGGDLDAALEQAQRVDAERQRMVRSTVQRLSDEEALRFARAQEDVVDLATDLSTRAPNDRGVVQGAWALVANNRALVLDVIARRREHLARLPRPTTADSWRAFEARSESLAAELIRGPAGGDLDTWSRRLATLRRDRDAAERELADLAAASMEAPGTGIDLDELRAGLQEGEALVAYVSAVPLARLTGGDARRRTGAFVLAGPDATPRFVALATTDSLSAVARRFEEELRDGWRVGHRDAATAEHAVRDAGVALRTLVWDPVAPWLPDARHVFVVPDAPLHGIDFHTLPEGDGYVVEGEVGFQRLTREADLLVRARPLPADAALVLVGGVDFEATTQGPQSTGARSRGPDCAAAANRHFDALPATLEEILAIESLWRRLSPRSDVTVLESDEATESMLRHLAPRADVLHLATHGFDVSAECWQLGELRTRGVGVLRPVDEFTGPRLSPLRTQGLVFAGVNAGGAGATQARIADDGWMTTEEIATLDLARTQWAVLSACDTGRIDPLAPDGLTGLARALRIAGVRTIVGSLWNVDDEVARDWMVRMYRAHLEDGLSVVDAARAASRTLLSRARESGGDTHPRRWAGFVVLGVAAD